MTVNWISKSGPAALALAATMWAWGATAQGQAMMPMMPMMPQGQAMMPMMPMMPQGQAMMPMMPQGQAMMPMMPQGQAMMPMMPQGQAMMPMMPQGQAMMPMMPQGQAMMPGIPRHPPIQPMDMLALSDEQRAQMTTIAEETQVAIMTIMRDMYTQSGTLRGLFQVMPPDPAKIGSAYGKMFDLQRQVIETNIGAFNRYMGVMSDEQQATWRRMRTAMAGVHQ